eukprot:m.7323 g.7323  ORF g.7323 m.7323 type:complete len:304 (+) comp5234_c0_seq2:32-943(+)
MIVVVLCDMPQGRHRTWQVFIDRPRVFVALWLHACAHLMLISPLFELSDSKAMGACGSTEGRAGRRQVIDQYNVVYFGRVQLPAYQFPGVDACYFALQEIKERYVGQVDTPATLTVSIFGLKALRNAFANMTQQDAMEFGDGGVSFELVADVQIFRIKFCTDINDVFCFICQDEDTDTFWCHAFECKSKKVARKVSESTADACAKVFSTVNVLKEKISAPQEVESADAAGEGEQAQQNQSSLIQLISEHGYADADEKFKQEMLELAGIESIPYQEPNPDERQPPSMRTIVRQADPNEYERTRL